VLMRGMLGQGLCPWNPTKGGALGTLHFGWVAVGGWRRLAKTDGLQRPRLCWAWAAKRTKGAKPLAFLRSPDCAAPDQAQNRQTGGQHQQDGRLRHQCLTDRIAEQGRIFYCQGGMNAAYDPAELGAQKA
jgi:hypothetical protein